MRDVEHFGELYFNLGFTNKEILNLLAHQHHIVISIRTFKKNMQENASFPEKEPDVYGGNRCFSGVELRRARQYTCSGPNALWHMDSYDKLKPYGIAINDCIDGFSSHAMFSLLTRKKVVINLTANYTLAFSFQPPLVLH